MGVNKPRLHENDDEVISILDISSVHLEDFKPRVILRRVEPKDQWMLFSIFRITKVRKRNRINYFFLFLTTTKKNYVR